MKQTVITLLVILIVMTSASVYGQTDSTAAPAPPAKDKKKWYETVSLRGYTQIRYNRFLETNPDLKCEQCDKSWGGNGGIFVRRIRLIFFGDVHERVYVYIQPDFASSPASGVLNFAQIRDAYFDLSLNKTKSFRLRFGQSKIPYGFENLQSSQNRLPLDRGDAINSALANERDLGLMFYWAPAEIRKRFSYLVRSGLKGSGDYGVFGLGVFNGQTANKPDENTTPHIVSRISYPFQFKNGQIIEPGVQAYSGRYVVTSVTSGVQGINDDYQYWDQRVAGSLIIYPQPFGFAAEYNYGTGPEYNPATNTIEQRNLYGGYAMASYLFRVKNQVFVPFTRYQYYNGGKKHELDARRYIVREFEAGVEWQPIENFETVVMYTISDRVFEDGVKTNNYQYGSLLRLQFQFNY